jgi:hypothetical protein
MRMHGPGPSGAPSGSTARRRSEWITADLAAAHLDVYLLALNRGLRLAVEAQAATARSLDGVDGARAITDREAATLLERVESLPAGPLRPSPLVALTTDEREAVDELRIVASSHGASLPLDSCQVRLGLDDGELVALVAVAAPEVDRGYERLYSYVCDEIGRLAPSVELLALLASGWQDRHRHRLALGPYGRLRRSGLLVPTASPAFSGLREELRLGAGVLEFLLGGVPDLGAVATLPAVIPDSLDGDEVRLTPYDARELASGLEEGDVEVVGLWAPSALVMLDAAKLISGLLDRECLETPLRPETTAADAAASVRRGLQAAAMAGALPLVTMDEHNRPDADAIDAVGDVLAATRLPVLLGGTHPWQPVRVLAARDVVDVRAEPAGWTARRHQWQTAAPSLGSSDLDDLAGCFQLAASELTAATRHARTSRRLAAASGRDGDKASDLSDHLRRGAVAVSHSSSSGVVRPQITHRTLTDLVLPSSVMAQVVEVAACARALPRVEESWGFDLSGTTGFKALFLGDPGTGKTLAAEVIASMLGLPLLKVDLAQTVSKWVGETAKNLDAVFADAATSNAVLFFDEADALFGKRGDVRHGTDRYANTEVSHLLQRFERHHGLVILASNLRENIDPAFTRRFHGVLHFPRPDEDARRRLWAIAFPPAAPIGDDVDFGTLAVLELTGAGIASSARLAALLAADDGAQAITMDYVVRAVAHQFRAEARVLRPDELGRHAALLDAGPAGVTSARSAVTV